MSRILRHQICGAQNESKKRPTRREVYFVWLSVEMLTLDLLWRKSAVNVLARIVQQE